MKLVYEVIPNNMIRNRIRISIMLAGCGLIITSLITLDPIFSIISISCFAISVFIFNTFLKIYDNRIVLDTVYPLKIFQNELKIDLEEIKEVYLLKRGWDLGKLYKNRIGFSLNKRSPKIIYQIGDSEDFLKAYNVIKGLFQQQSHYITFHTHPVLGKYFIKT